MLKQIKAHAKNNSGDANVSRITLIAIVFVVGAILLVLTTSAFRQPINNWFDKVTASWFKDSNGMFEADNQWLFEAQNENGTYSGAIYIMKLGTEGWIVLDMPEGLRNGTEHAGSQGKHGASTSSYIAGNHTIGWLNKSMECVISSDGRTITFDGDMVFEAYLPGDPNIPSSIPTWMIPGNN